MVLNDATIYDHREIEFCDFDLSKDEILTSVQFSVRQDRLKFQVECDGIKVRFSYWKSFDTQKQKKFKLQIRAIPT